MIPGRADGILEIVTARGKCRVRIRICRASFKKLNVWNWFAEMHRQSETIGYISSSAKAACDFVLNYKKGTDLVLTDKWVYKIKTGNNE